MISSKHGYFQQLGKALMLPVSLLPVAGILLGLGSSGGHFLPEVVTSLMTQTGELVFITLPLFFCCWYRHWPFP